MKRKVKILRVDVSKIPPRDVVSYLRGFGDAVKQLSVEEADVKVLPKTSLGERTVEA